MKALAFAVATLALPITVRAAAHACYGETCDERSDIVPCLSDVGSATTVGAASDAGMDSSRSQRR
jgi:hypothetical protein